MNELREKVIEIFKENISGTFNEKGLFEFDIYADYRDEIDDKTVIKILNSENPLDAFYEALYNAYMESEFYYKDIIIEDVFSHLSVNDEETEEEIKEIISDLLVFNYPEDHFLKQEFYVNIMIDTGDGNYDYTLNSVYPCYAGRIGEIHHDKAAIVWLAKQQGYGKRVFRKNMEEGDIANPHGFLQSMRQELANLPSAMSSIVFLVKMTLEDLIRLNQLIKLQDRNGHHYDSSKNPDCGYIILDKATETGLYNPWDGGGSLFEIELEKDVKLPIRFIRSALPDGGDGYSIDSVYRMSGSCWRDTIKKIVSPKIIT